MEPGVSILWINYNSLNFIDLALESLQAVKDLNYSNYELIAVDNGSIDDSFPTIKSFIKKNGIRSRTISLDRNFGYTGGNNFAYANRNQNSKYVVLLNNDAVPKRDSLKELVGFMEADESLGSAQGVILNYDERSIDTAGDYLDELFRTHPLLEGKHPQSLGKPVYITSADGAYSIHRVEAIKKTTGRNDSILDDFIFACFDDYLLGLRLWNSGFKVKTFPLITAKHKRGTSFNRANPLRAYLGARNWIILNEISNSRYKNLIKPLFVKQLYEWFLAKIFSLNTELGSRELPPLLSRAFLDGMRIGRTKRRLGETIDMYRAPILRIPYLTALLGITTRLQSIDPHIRKELDKIANLDANGKWNVQ